MHQLRLFPTQTLLPGAHGQMRARMHSKYSSWLGVPVLTISLPVSLVTYIYNQCFGIVCSTAALTGVETVLHTLRTGGGPCRAGSTASSTCVFCI